MKQENQFNDLLKKMERYCAYQERSEFEIQKKLKLTPLSSEEIALIITSLNIHNFLNESRFIESYIRGKANIKGWGEHKIRHGLRQHRIEEKEINAALLIHLSEKNIPFLKILLEKKRALLQDDSSPIKIREKIIRFALSKGYSLSDILACLHLDSMDE